MDLLQAKGLYPLPEGTSPILGVEVSGVVKEVSQSSHFQVGDEVMALLPGGGYAEYAVCDMRTVTKIPRELSLLTASALPEAFMTAYQLLFFIAKVKAGESVLLHAAASSVGQAAIQMCTQRNVTVFVTTRSPEKMEICLELGASAGWVVGSDHFFASDVVKATEGIGVDVILDPVGANYLKENINALRYDGRLVSYGLLSGGIVPDELNSNESPTLLKLLLFKRISYLASTLRARSIEYKAELISSLLNDQYSGYPAVAGGRIEVNISNLFPLEDVVSAHALMKRNKNIGKIVLQVNRNTTTIAGNDEFCEKSPH